MNTYPRWTAQSSGAGRPNQVYLSVCPCASRLCLKHYFALPDAPLVGEKAPRNDVLYGRMERGSHSVPPLLRLPRVMQPEFCEVHKISTCARVFACVFLIY